MTMTKSYLTRDLAADAARKIPRHATRMRSDVDQFLASAEGQRLTERQRARLKSPEGSREFALIDGVMAAITPMLANLTDSVEAMQRRIAALERKTR
jgi:hypothetical protein